MTGVFIRREEDSETQTQKKQREKKVKVKGQIRVMLPQVKGY